MPARVRKRRRVAMHIAVAVQPIRDRIRRGKLPQYRIVVARTMIVQPAARAVLPLPRKAPARRHRAVGVARAAIGRVELLRRHVPATVYRAHTATSSFRCMLKVDAFLLNGASTCLASQ